MAPREIAADILDSRRDDWTITDDGPNRGPVRTWPAPILPKNDATPIVTRNASEAFPNARLTRSGLPDAYAFLRPQTDAKKLGWEDFPDEEFNPPADVPAYADAMGYPQYRTVPKPLSSFEYDVPGVDRYTPADMLAKFMRRTDAGALDAWGHFSGNECRGLYRSLSLDDAGMPKSWYEVIDKYREDFISKLKAWSGGKFMQGDVQLLRDSFAALISHATDSEKWDRFNQTKALTFKLLDSVDSPIVSSGVPSATSIMALGKFGGAAKAEKTAPIAAQVARAPMSPAHGAHVAEFTQMWKALETHINNQGGGMLSFVGKAATGTATALGSAAADIGKGVYAVGKGIATPVAALVTSPVKLASDIASGKNVFESLKDTVKRDLSSAKDLAPYVQAAISIIPVGGTLVSGAISAGSALAQGKPITEAIVSGIKGALPGGPVASAAFDVAYAAARGQNLGDAALQALVNQAPGGEVGKQAAMAAIAVAKGQNLQQAALAAAKGAALQAIPGGVPNVVKDVATNIVEGKNVVNAVTTAVGKEAMANFSPLARGVLDNTGPQLLTKAAQSLPSLLPTDARLVAQSLLKNPALRSLPIEEVARRLGVSNFVAREGMGAVLQAVQKSGGSVVPTLSQAKDLASRIPAGVSFDQAMSAFGSRAAPKAYTHNAVNQQRAARLRRAGGVYHALQARGLDCGALDPLKMPTIKQGSTGDPVIQWQKILNITADGKFGPNTHNATVAFQKKNGLTPDGIVGPKTWTAGLVTVVSTTPPATIPGTTVPISLPPPTTTAPIIAKDMPTIQQGSSGPPVKTWQIFLNIPADGIFGPQTKAATVAFQTKNGLVADGIVGPKTWEKAMSGTSVPTQPPGTPPPPVIISTPPVSIPPISIPPIIPGLPPVTTPPVNIPPVVITEPPRMPPVITTPPMPPNPPGQPPPPPPITTSPPSTPPVVLPPPGTPPSKTAGSGLLIAGAVVLGGLLLMGSGSRSKII